MNKVEQLLQISDAFLSAATNSGLAEKTLSYRLFRDAGTFRRLRGGGDLTTRKWDSTVEWFSDNWPDEAVWPAKVPRPGARVEAAE